MEVECISCGLNNHNALNKTWPIGERLKTSSSNYSVWFDNKFPFICVYIYDWFKQ